MEQEELNECPPVFFAAVRRQDGTEFKVSSFKVPISSKFWFSHLTVYFLQWTSAKKVFDLDKKQFLYEVLKPWKFHFQVLRSTRAADHIIDMLRVVT